jgi:hypothetical protein
MFSLPNPAMSLKIHETEQSDEIRQQLLSKFYILADSP